MEHQQLPICRHCEVVKLLFNDDAWLDLIGCLFQSDQACYTTIMSHFFRENIYAPKQDYPTLGWNSAEGGTETLSPALQVTVEVEVVIWLMLVVTQPPSCTREYTLLLPTRTWKQCKKLKSIGSFVNKNIKIKNCQSRKLFGSSEEILDSHYE